jgi:tRNA A37 methylthiotransferase MiaB
MENVLLQAKEIINSGGKEIVLTGVNTGDFGLINGTRRHNFAELLQVLDDLPGINRIRISSIAKSTERGYHFHGSILKKNSAPFSYPVTEWQ